MSNFFLKDNKKKKTKQNTTHSPRNQKLKGLKNIYRDNIPRK